MTSLQAPFPWFGGKSRVAHLVWEAFGDVVNYVEPFAGSLAVLLGRPQPFSGVETVNDKDGFICNFWRAVQAVPDEVAHYCDWPQNENDLHARHAYLVRQRDSLTARLEGDPEFYDAKIAGWWCWGICCWIGGGWCSGDGPWQQVEGQLLHLGNQGQGVRRQLLHLGDQGRGVHRQRLHLSDQGQGVRRQRLHLSDQGQGVHRQRLHLGNQGRGVHRQRLHLGDQGRGVHRQRQDLYDWMQTLADRLRNVRVCCGDWARVCGRCPTTKLGLTAVFLDPPYGEEANRDGGIYAVESQTVAQEVRAWCLECGHDPLLRIALCGYEGEHNELEKSGWRKVAWKAAGGYGSQGNGRGRANREQERIWFSPHCLDRQPGLFSSLPIEYAG